MELELWIIVRLLCAVTLGGVIGFEREQTGKAAGVRTHMLVALGAAMFVSFNSLFTLASQSLAPAGGPGNFRIQIEPLATIDAVVTGISFLCAGLIFVSRESDKVKNLTTAASIWVTAAIGIAVALDRYLIAVASTAIVLVILNGLGGLLPSARRASPTQPERSAD